MTDQAAAIAEESYWRTQAASIRHDELATVRKAADTWTTLLTAVLGVFGTVAFAGGLPALEDLNDTLQFIVKVVTAAAVVCAVIATVYASKASGTSTKTTNNTSWQGVQKAARDNAVAARTQLAKAKRWGIAAAALVLGGSLLILFAGSAKPDPAAPSVIANVNGTIACGPLTKASNGALSAGTTPLNGATSITVVPACP
jgi:hypothetical protein